MEVSTLDFVLKFDGIELVIFWLIIIGFIMMYDAKYILGKTLTVRQSYKHKLLVFLEYFVILK